MLLHIVVQVTRRRVERTEHTVLLAEAGGGCLKAAKIFFRYHLHSSANGHDRHFVGVEIQDHLKAIAAIAIAEPGFLIILFGSFP